MTNDELMQLKALAEAATPGPWERDTIRSNGEYGGDDDGGYGYDSYEVTDEKGRCIMDCLNNDNGAVHVSRDGEAWDEVAKHNTAYVAAANPSAILALIAKVESLAVPSAANGAELPELPEPMGIDWPTLNSNALGCGVEDRGLNDRYECAEYGWQDGVDMAAYCVPDAIYDADQMQAYARAAVLAEREQVAAMCDELKEQRFASGNVREGSAARTLAEMIRART